MLKHWKTSASACEPMAARSEHHIELYKRFLEMIDE